MPAPLVPEIDVHELQSSLRFYTSVCGFEVLYQRPDERFAYLCLEGAELMLQEAEGPGRRFRTAPLERPYGRGINFQIQVADVDGLYARVQDHGSTVIVDLEERWYGMGATEAGNRQFVVADPDGYLMRFFQDLGERPLRP